MASTMTLPVPQDYRYVLTVLAASGVVSLWHSRQVGRARRIAQVPFPNAYASAEAAAADPNKYVFNCAQRAHMNYLEAWVPTMSTMIVAGLQFPIPAAAAGALWLVGRIFYQRGYVDLSISEGKGRRRGRINHLGQVVLLGLAGWTVVGFYLPG